MDSGVGENDRTFSDHPGGVTAGAAARCFFFERALMDSLRDSASFCEHAFCTARPSLLEGLGDSSPSESTALQKKSHPCSCGFCALELPWAFPAP